MGGNFLVNTVLLRKYHFTESKASLEVLVQHGGNVHASRGVFSAPGARSAVSRKLPSQSSLNRLRDFFTSWEAEIQSRDLTSGLTATEVPWRLPPFVQMKLTMGEALKHQSSKG